MALEQPPKKQIPTSKRIKRIAIALAVLAMYIWTFVSIDIDFARVIERASANFSRVLPRLFSPNWDMAGEVVEMMIETIFIAYVGSLAAAILAIPLGFLAAHNITNSKILTTIGKWILSAVRAFPEIILAILFVVVVGPTPFAGILAIAIGSTGMLGKLYSEVLESIDMNIVEAMKANGSNGLQIMFHGIFPQIIPEFLSYAIYRFEVDVRASTILGYVGAGGIGTMIFFAQSSRNWSDMGMILLVIIVVVTIIDYTSSYIRKRIV
ncbi:MULTISPECIES: phosphonate ABC transporter, permease protein PhnE [Allobacillus]|uniref:Phosphonate ABC transporter, permease protein PhnE n=1 Tax=Allobacillus halotolerans TaxID=570278 RepID=A0ABS6GRP3_9BACI|nr:MULTISPECIES: phosphonate ABC transporter, permease protein PhnE [Allobacillus]MBU6081792.1 phosphonate ABC transporter, permease protein PhnE [Allobacillus halotolerans]TSJ63463.1 phosphonate ABC transporter, permease protein PhnE [Allobacillus sp. SKP2-8]